MGSQTQAAEKGDGARREAAFLPRAEGAGAEATAARALRGVMGNLALQRRSAVEVSQQKPRVTAPGDSHEQEADRVTRQILARANAPDVTRGAVEVSAAPRPDARAVAGALRSSPAEPLDAATRDAAEREFGRDFGGVRVRTGSAAAESARELGARAYTVGQDIVFGAGEYAPQTAEGKRLLTHELAHTLQQTRGGAGSDGPIPRAPVSANEALTGATGVPTTMQTVRLSATIAAGQELTRDADKIVHTVADTRVTIWVTAQRLSVEFAPELVITANAWHGANLWLEEIHFDFATGTFGWRANARNITWLFGGRERLTSGLAGLFGGLPAAMRAPGYSPFDDANLQSNLAALAASFASGGGGGSGLPRASSVGLSATVRLGGELRRSSGRFSLVIPSGTSVTVEARLQGGIPGSLADIRVDSINLQLQHPQGVGANVEVRILDVGVPAIFIDAVNFAAGGRLTFTYTLATEALEGLFRLVAVGAAVAAGRGGEVGEGALDYSQPRMRAIVDAEIQRNIEPLLRDLIVTNRHAIAGIDLAVALGVGP